MGRNCSSSSCGERPSVGVCTQKRQEARGVGHGPSPPLKRPLAPALRRFSLVAIATPSPEASLPCLLLLPSSSSSLFLDSSSLSSSMTCSMASHAVALATAMAVSGTLIFLVICRQRPPGQLAGAQRPPAFPRPCIAGTHLQARPTPPFISLSLPSSLCDLLLPLPFLHRRGPFLIFLSQNLQIQRRRGASGGRARRGGGGFILRSA